MNRQERNSKIAVCPSTIGDFRSMMRTKRCDPSSQITPSSGGWLRSPSDWTGFQESAFQSPFLLLDLFKVVGNRALGLAFGSVRSEQWVFYKTLVCFEKKDKSAMSTDSFSMAVFLALRDRYSSFLWRSRSKGPCKTG